MKHTIIITLILAASANLCHAQAIIPQAPKNNGKVKKMEAKKMKVEIWSDMVCPFCYLGKRRYETALKQFTHAADVEVTWHSFQLYPQLPRNTHVKETSYQHIAKMKGISYAQSVQMHDNVVNMAKGDGLHYHFDKAIVANSFNAHRLMHMAQKQGLGNEAEERIFKAYFMDGKDLSDRATLVTLGVDIGLDKAAVEHMLAGNDYAAEVDADIKEASKLGINGVPFFVFDRKYAVSGAQPVDTFLSTLQHSFAEWRKDHPGK
jgi:protein disulfide-isomerase